MTLLSRLGHARLEQSAQTFEYQWATVAVAVAYLHVPDCVHDDCLITEGHRVVVYSNMGRGETLLGRTARYAAIQTVFGMI